MLYELRIHAGLRQKDLAALVGVEQSYCSALELGLKGPPNQNLINRLIEVLNLDTKKQNILNEAVKASQRKFDVPAAAPIEIFWLCHKLRQQIDRLHPVQIELITVALNLPSEFGTITHNHAGRIRRRDHKSITQKEI